ncbi:MAG: acylneuraminate cytidylyltransferase family protein [Sulfuricaulis sp.]|uniref:acylneuraminate cytidylyltransferase family protein n=1 Tax=Sulfuricaulis sp. TaxID=2003553 RepID=UPI0034A2D43B
MTEVIAIIPARSGSKGVPQKNVLPLMGHPLIAFSIAAAMLSKCIGRTIVTTDSEEIAEVARMYGADVPFLRPAELASEISTDRDFLVHALEWLGKHERVQPEYLVQLRPTTPLRDPAVIDTAVQQFRGNPEASSLRSAHIASKTPYKWFEIDERGYFKGIRPGDTRPEYYNLPRQSFPAVYDPNGYVDVVRATQILTSASVHGSKIMAFITPFCHEIDSLEDVAFLHYLAEQNGSPLLDFLKIKRQNACNARSSGQVQGCE